MYDVLEIRITAVQAGLKKLYDELAPLETARISEYKRTSPIHNFLMNSKEKSGFQILLNAKSN